MNPELDRKVEIPTAKPTAESKAAKRDQLVKSGPIMINQYEAALEISHGQGISIIGPLGTVFIERPKEFQERDNIEFSIIFIVYLEKPED